MNNPYQKVTVALVCYKEKEQIALLLEDLKKQSAFNRLGEVLVCQNGDCQQTKKTVKSFLNQLPLKIFYSPSNNLGQARAILVKQAQYELIAWTDSDCRLPKNWLEETLLNWENACKPSSDKLCLKPSKKKEAIAPQAFFVQKMENSSKLPANSPPVLAIGGPNRLPENKWWQKTLNLSLSHPLGHGLSPQAWRVFQKTKVSHIPTTNGLFLKSAILSVGNFKSHLLGEDLDLGLRLKKRGELFLFPRPLVINHYASSYGMALKRLFLFGKARGRFRPDNKILFALQLCFAPSIIGSFLLGFFNPYFLLGPAGYFLLLFLSGCFVSGKQGLILPFFWLFQHGAYSAGALWEISHKLKKFLFGLGH